MDDFEEKLNSILSSPEAMGQIMALANSISGQPGEGETPEDESASVTGPGPADSGGENPLSFLQNLDPSMIQKVMALYGEYNRSNDEKTALLQAMKPFLRKERQVKLDKAVQIARFSRVIRAALEQFKGDRDV